MTETLTTFREVGDDLLEGWRGRSLPNRAPVA